MLSLGGIVFPRITAAGNSDMAGGGACAAGSMLAATVVTGPVTDADVSRRVSASPTTGTRRHNVLMSEPDWRLRGQEKYLSGIGLIRRQWSQTRDGWDHDHCQFCWAKFAAHGDADALHEGWTSVDEYWWVCDACFNDFRAQFGWTLIEG